MMRGWTSVFRFSFRKTAGAKGYIITTVLVAALLLMGFSGGMLAAELLGSDSADKGTGIRRAVTVGDADFGIIAGLGDETYVDVTFETAPDFDKAVEKCAGDGSAIILVVENGTITAVTPEDSDVDAAQAEAFAGYLAGVYPYALAALNGAADSTDVPAYTVTEADENDAVGNGISEIIGMIVPYVVVMLMYFMVLIYGQGIANDAIMEKTSKLMDLFLVSIKPGAMLLGKTLAGAAAGIMQTLVWIFSAVGGLALGRALVMHVNPNTDMALAAVVDGAGALGAMLSPGRVIVAALVIVAGFLVYCALAGMGGALASKPEDLGSTNYLFTMALVISFFACIFSGESAGMISDAVWMGYVPFTAVLVMPGRLLTGSATIGQGIASIGISAAAAVALCLIAGKVYAMTAFYRGKPLNPVKLIRSFIK